MQRDETILFLHVTVLLLMRRARYDTFFILSDVNIFDPTVCLSGSAGILNCTSWIVDYAEDWSTRTLWTQGLRVGGVSPLTAIRLI